MIDIILFPLVLVFDSFITSIIYSINRVKISYQSILIISFIGTLFLSLSILFANTIKSLFSSLFCTLLSFALLFLLGLVSLFRYFIKQLKEKKTFSFQLQHIHFVIDIYFDELKADMDYSSSLSSKEAIFLAIALSFDSLLSGFGIGLADIQIHVLLLITFILNMVSMFLGVWIGKKIKYFHQDFSWISAIIFFVLAISKLYS